MTSRANLIKCKGLVTNENELSVSEGSLKQATNVNVDERGVITPRRGFSEFSAATGGSLSSANNVKQIIEYKDRIFRHYADKLEFEDNAGGFQAIAGTYTELLAGYRLKWQESKGNMYFTTDSGVKKISEKTNSNMTATGTITVEDAGIPKAAYIEAAPVDTVGGFLPIESKVGYRFIFGRKDANNNLLLGSPSNRFVVENSNVDTTTFEESTITVDTTTNADPVIDGDYFTLSTSTKTYTMYMDTTGGSAVIPATADTIGTTLVAVDVTGNTSNDANIAAILANTIANNVPEFTVTLPSSTVVNLVSTEESDITNIGTAKKADGTALPNSPTRLTTTTSVAYSLVEGSEANADVTVIIPNTITTDYFVQVYRTNFISVSTGLTLSDLDPGDEMNLVYETGLASADITAGEITFTDTTPESFRASAAPLYTNEVTGEGILQSNDRPPIALDVELFRNSMFFANTKSTHRLEFTMLSVDDFINDTTKVVIGNSTISRYYTAAAAEDKDTTEGGDFELSTAVSVAQAIDETARSLVKIINQDSSSPVNAFYLSGADDLPGQVLLEARSLTDTSFFLALDSGAIAWDVGTAYVIGDQVKLSGVLYTCILGNTGNTPPNATYWKVLVLGAEFSPELPEAKPMVSLSGTGPATNIELTAHGYTTGDIVYVSFLNEDPVDVDAPADIAGTFTVTVVDVDNFTIPVANLASVDSGGANPFSVVTSAVFGPDVESDNFEAANRLYYSKTDEPEAVPFANFINIGAQDEPIRRILALRDNLFVLKDDGVFLVSGTSAPNFSVRQTDNTKIIAPDSAVVLNNQIYCLTAQGISKINGSGQVGVISRGIENLIDEVANASFDFIPNTFGITYENDRSYILFMPQIAADTSATQAYRYNIFEQTWTKWEYEATCGHVMARDAKLYVGNGDRNFVSQERKNFDRTDQSDRTFSTSITTSGVTDKEVILASLLDVEVSDVITQTQVVSINYLNSRILRRMDEFDTGITAPALSTMVLSFGASVGDDMASKVQDLNDYLVTLDAANITVKVINTANLKTQMELLVTELNTSATITVLKDYSNPESVIYEAYITETISNGNKIMTHIERPFLSGAVEVHKHIKKVVEWNPQHFGDPSALKQVREVTIMFDQNNFYSAKARFGSDIAQNFTDIEFSGKGIGYYGDQPFGEATKTAVDYFGGEGNDIPFRTIVPRGKQRCRYLTMVFEHNNARESFRIIGISGVVRAISSRAYK